MSAQNRETDSATGTRPESEKRGSCREAEGEDTKYGRSLVVLLSLVFMVSVQQKVPAVGRGIYIEFSGSFGTVTREGRVSLKSPRPLSNAIDT